MCLNQTFQGAQALICGGECVTSYFTQNWHTCPDQKNLILSTLSASQLAERSWFTHILLYINPSFSFLSQTVVSDSVTDVRLIYPLPIEPTTLYTAIDLVLLLDSPHLGHVIFHVPRDLTHIIILPPIKVVANQDFTTWWFPLPKDPLFLDGSAFWFYSEFWMKSTGPHYMMGRRPKKEDHSRLAGGRFNKQSHARHIVHYQKMNNSATHQETIKHGFWVTCVLSRWSQ